MVKTRLCVFVDEFQIHATLWLQTRFTSLFCFVRIIKSDVTPVQFYFQSKNTFTSQIESRKIKCLAAKTPLNCSLYFYV